MDSWVTSLLPVFSFLCPSVLDLGSGMGQTDGQTDDGHQSIMPHPMGAGNNKPDSAKLFNAAVV